MEEYGWTGVGWKGGALGGADRGATGELVKVKVRDRCMLMNPRPSFTPSAKIRKINNHKSQDRRGRGGGGGR